MVGPRKRSGIRLTAEASVVVLLASASSGCAIHGHYYITPRDLAASQSLPPQEVLSTAVPAEAKNDVRPLWLRADALQQGRILETSGSRVLVEARGSQSFTPVGAVLLGLGGALTLAGGAIIAGRGGENAGLSVGGGVVLIGLGAAHAIIGGILLGVGRNKSLEVKPRDVRWNYLAAPSSPTVAPSPPASGPSLVTPGAPSAGLVTQRDDDEVPGEGRRPTRSAEVPGGADAATWQRIRQYHQAAREMMAKRRAWGTRLFLTMGVGVGAAPFLSPASFRLPMGASLSVDQCLLDACPNVALVLGVGLRRPLGTRWDFDFRLDAAYQPGRAQASRIYYSSLGGPGPAEVHPAPQMELTLDFSFRVRPIAPQSPHYLGLGFRLGAMLFPGPQRLVTLQPVEGVPSSVETPDSFSALPATGAVLELGTLLGQREQWDLGVRLVAGYPTAYRCYFSGAWAFR